MAGNAKGEIVFQAGAKQYIWVFSVDAICALEDHLDKGLVAITDELQSWLPPTRVVDGKAVPVRETAAQLKARNSRVRMGFARAVFWAGLQDHQPDCSLKMAGDVIKELGGLIPAMDVIVRGLGVAFPDAGEPGKEPTARPRKASQKAG